MKGAHGYGAGKKVTGHKRHALVDADGRLPLAAVSHTFLHDSCGSAALLAMSHRLWPFLTHGFADCACVSPRMAGTSPVAVTLVGHIGAAVMKRALKNAA